MKNFLLGAGILLILLVSIIAINTAQFKSRQFIMPPVDPVDIDLEAAATRFADALQFPTISGTDTSTHGAASFDSLHTYLERIFPGVHASLRREIIGTASLLYYWEGTAPELDPVVFMAHQDVVPVEPGTERAWDYPPFSGEIADGYIWGRGALDNKNGILATLEAVEHLLKEGYRPARTVILAYGHDEEIGGMRGAQDIVQKLQADGIAPWLVVDEGGVILADHPMPVEAPVALVGIAEKGYLSLALTVQSAGGHSSMPGRDTAIGTLSRALNRLTSSPFPARLEGVTGQFFDYLGPEMPILLRSVFANRWLFGPLLTRQLAADPGTDALLRTTTAPTMLSGSPKDNVLPSQAQAVVNFRILPGESVESVIQRVQHVIDDPRVEIAPANEVGKNPSPVSPTDGDGFVLLQKTIHEVFPETVVAPYLVVGGTDARHFTEIASNVYRFMPFYFREGDMARLHGTNERVLKEDYDDAIRFYRQLILNATAILE